MGKLNALIRQAARQADWVHPHGESYQQLVNVSHKAGRKKWNVYIKEQFHYTGLLLSYLVNYLRGGPLKNAQIKRVDKQQVTFQYYSHRRNPNGKKDTPSYRSLSLSDFFTLYLAHIPHPGKMLVRYYGLYANHTTERLNQARKVLGQLPIQSKEKVSWRDYLEHISSAQQHAKCRTCHQPLTVLKALPRLSLNQ